MLQGVRALGFRQGVIRGGRRGVYIFVAKRVVKEHSSSSPMFEGLMKQCVCCFAKSAGIFQRPVQGQNGLIQSRQVRNSRDVLLTDISGSTMLASREIYRGSISGRVTSD
jgi:hypothetical protein